MIPVTLLLLSALQGTPGPGAQGAPPPTPPATPSADASAKEGSTAVQVEALKQRIHAMRSSLLFGGEKVREAESQAVDFYGSKVESLEKGLDAIAADLTEKRASYGVALDQALSESDPAARAAAVRRAQQLRAEIGDLEQQAKDLTTKRDGLSKLIGAVQSRSRERERLASEMDASTGLADEGFGLDLGAVGLAPEVPTAPDVSPFDDPDLLADMLQRDPAGARRVLFQMDPVRYWQRFPLRPPADVLHAAFELPLPDLPGRR